MITPAQCRAGRAWLNLTQVELARMIGCSPNVVVDFEGNRRNTRYVWKIEQILVEKGIRFPNNGINGALTLSIDPQTKVNLLKETETG